MTEKQMIEMWEALFALGKGITYILFMAAMVKYLWS